MTEAMKLIQKILWFFSPCRKCKVYRKNKGYDFGTYDKKKDEYKKGICSECCWFYDSKFEVGK